MGLHGSGWREQFLGVDRGKCEYVSFVGLPIVAGYPLTNKTLPTREAYMQRWGEIPNVTATNAYDVVRFILPDAIKRAGTTETEAVIKLWKRPTLKLLRRGTLSSLLHMTAMSEPLDRTYPVRTTCWLPFQWQANAPKSHVSQADNGRDRSNLPVSTLEGSLEQQANSLMASRLRIE